MEMIAWIVVVVMRGSTEGMVMVKIIQVMFVIMMVVMLAVVLVVV